MALRAAVRPRRSSPAGTTEESIDRDMIHPVVLHDIERCITARQWWKQVSDWTEGIAHILLAFNGILAFMAGVYEIRAIAICAGIIATLSIVLLKYSAYALNECDERHALLCQYLEYFHVRSPPSLSPRLSGMRPQTDPNNTPVESSHIIDTN